MTTMYLMLAVLTFARTASAVTAEEFSARARIHAGTYALIKPASASCAEGELNFHEDPTDGSLTLSLGASTLAHGFGPDLENVADGDECRIIALRSEVADGTAWTDLRETCDGAETHVITRLVATARGFKLDERSADAHTVCTYVRKP